MMKPGLTVAAASIFSAAVLICALLDAVAEPTPQTPQASAQQSPPFAKGQIEKVDLIKKLVVIKTNGGKQTLSFTDRTYIFRGKEKLTADKLKAGDAVALRYYTDKNGRAVVIRMKLKAPEPAVAPESSPLQ